MISNAAFPYQLAAKLVRDPKKATAEDIREFVSTARFLYDRMVAMEWEASGLRQDILRLTHENEFMLRLINQKEAPDA